MGKPMPSRNRECKKRASEQKHWSCLPSPILEKIYCLVSRADKLHMSLVCRWWSEEFRSSSVIKTFRLALTKSQLSNDNYMQKLRRFVEKHSILFQHVEIECIYYNGINLIDIWIRYFIEFLKILTRNSRLISVKFQSLWFYYYFYDSICRAIIEFLESQCQLKMAVFKDCYFRFPVGLEILSKLFYNNRNSLSHVCVTRFFQNRNSSPAENIPTFLDLSRLISIEMDYSFMFENIFIVLRQGTVFETLKKGPKLALSKIILHFKDINVKNFQGLTKADWQSLKILCPDLEVELIIEKLSSYHQEKQFLIMPCMPITRLIFTIDSVLKPLLLFAYVITCGIHNNLDFLSIYSNSFNCIHDLGSTLIPFIQACKKLKCFVLSVVYKNIRIELLMESFLDNPHESLEEINITITKLENEDNYTTLKNLIKPYIARFRSTGLKLMVFYYDWNNHKIIC